MNFYLWGGCELDDCVPHLQKLLPTSEFHYIGGTTCGSLFSKPGPIAEAVHDWYEHFQANNSERVRSIQAPKNIYKEIVTKGFFDDWMIPYIKKDDWCILTYTKEIYPRYEHGGEHITLSNDIINDIKTCEKLKFPKHILPKLLDKKNIVGFDDEFVIHRYKNEWGPKMGEYISRYFDDRLLMVHIEPSRRRFSRMHGHYWTLPQIGTYSDVYASSNSKKYFNKNNWEEVNKTIKFLHTGFRMRYPHKIPTLSIKHTEVVGDDHHKWGKSAFHFDNKTSRHIANRIYKKIFDLTQPKIIDAG